MNTTNLHALAETCDAVNAWSGDLYPETLDPSLAELYAGVMDASAALAKGSRALAHRLEFDAAWAEFDSPKPTGNVQELPSTALTVRGLPCRRAHPQPTSVHPERNGGT